MVSVRRVWPVGTPIIVPSKRVVLRYKLVCLGERMRNTRIYGIIIKFGNHLLVVLHQIFMLRGLRRRWTIIICCWWLICIKLGCLGNYWIPHGWITILGVALGEVLSKGSRRGSLYIVHLGIPNCLLAIHVMMAEAWLK